MNLNGMAGAGKSDERGCYPRAGYAAHGAAVTRHLLRTS